MLRSCARGPATGGTTYERCPDLSIGTRPVVGERPYRPCRLAGMRTEPPMSVPMPTMEPRQPIRAPSPPEEPPEMRVLSKALTDCLKMWL